MSDYIKRDYIKREDAIKAFDWTGDQIDKLARKILSDEKLLPSADVVEVDKAQKEIDYWHDKAQSYEQTILKLSLNKADVVEVVRCKDCKYYVLHTFYGRTQGWCERLCDEFDRSLAHGTEVDDYCSHGERKEE